MLYPLSYGRSPREPEGSTTGYERTGPQARLPNHFGPALSASAEPVTSGNRFQEDDATLPPSHRLKLEELARLLEVLPCR